MKNKPFQTAFVIILALGMFGTSACKTKKGASKNQIVEGIIQYNVNYLEIPEGLKALENMLPKKMELAFKGNMIRMKQDIPMAGTQIQIVNGETLGSTTLTEMMGRKIKLSPSEEEIAAKQAKRKAAKVTETDETMQLAGYSCKKVIVSYPESEEEIYYAPAIVNAMGTANLKGMPLQFDRKEGGFHIRFVAYQADAQSVAADTFVAPEEYEALSEEEMKMILPKE